MSYAIVKASNRDWKSGSQQRPGELNCPLCIVNCYSERSWQRHLEDERHKYNFRISEFERRRSHKVMNRHGVEIRTTCDKEEVTFTEKDGTVKSVISPDTTTVEYEFEVVNIGRDKVVLQDFFFLHPYDVFKIPEEDDLSRTNKRPGITPNTSYTMRVCFINTNIGTYSVPVTFTFLRDKEGKQHEFDIIRVMEIVVGVDYSGVGVASSGHFRGEPWPSMEKTVPATTHDGRIIRRIVGYTVPSDYVLMFDNWLAPWPGITVEECDLLQPLMNIAANGYAALKPHYSHFFHSLLYLEEYDATRAIEMYNMSNVKLQIVKEPERLELEVPGLAEKRPSLIKGDLTYIRVRYTDNTTGTIEYEGYIVEVLDTVVWLTGFAPQFVQFVHDGECTFDVRFTFSRFPIYVMHRAIDLVARNQQMKVVFPEGNKLHLPLVQDDYEMQFFNQDIDCNPEQKIAVINILKGECRPSPYIIYGPPGTGKTATLVEAILQVKKKFPKSHILVCSLSNASCDNIALKLTKHCCRTELLRLHSSSRDWKSVPKGIHEYSNRTERLFYFPKKEHLQKFSIIVCSLITASRLICDQNEENMIGKHDFTHVFIDECGQAQEPESLVAIGGILCPSHKKKLGGQLILAGDPKQLGPMCQSRRAENVSLQSWQSEDILLDPVRELNRRIGLGVSLLERLMITCRLYQKNENGMYDQRYITKLLRNYRCHPDILQLPNSLFYGNELESNCPPNILNDPICERPLFGRKKGCHLVFHGVLGQESKEGHCPSYFNIYEVDQVVLYVEKLLQLGNGTKVEQSEIGIIAPYICQVQKIRKKLQDRKWQDIEVGTTEVFQGREKRVIIISAVRANKTLLDYDRKFQLGFLTNPKRLNVAITRAQSLLIVIANPFLVSKDCNWGQLLLHCHDLDLYTGCRFLKWDKEWSTKVVKRISKICTKD